MKEIVEIGYTIICESVKEIENDCDSRSREAIERHKNSISLQNDPVFFNTISFAEDKISKNIMNN